MKILRFVICFITTCALSVSLIGAGFFVVCSFPKMSGAISYVTCDTSNSPFSRDELSANAEAVHDYAFGTHSKNMLYQSIEDINTSAQTQYANSTRTAIANATDAYTLDIKAISHLDDCYVVAQSARVALIIIAGVACLGLILCGIIAKQRNLGRVLTVSGCIVIFGLLALIIFAIIDFDALFALFHSLFFASGTWTFSASSLLICSLPENFWICMAAIWAATSIILSIICLLIGSKCRKKARIRKIQQQSQAQYTPYNTYANQNTNTNTYTNQL